MWKKIINLHLVEYAIAALLRQKSKTVFIVTIFVSLISLLLSFFFIVNSIKYELSLTEDTLPQIILQNQKMGRVSDIDTALVDDLLQLEGVTDVQARVWGYYYFSNQDIYFTLVGIDSFENIYKKGFTLFRDSDELEKDVIYIGDGVEKLFSKSYYKDFFNFVTPDLKVVKLNIAGVFKAENRLESNDVIVMSKANARKVFGLDDEKATDIALWIANPKEIDTIAQKLKQLYPTYKVITHDDIVLGYEKLFNYKSGVFLVLFIVTLFTFFMIIYEKMSGMSSQERKEVGILKAIGWSIDDIIKEKFYEAWLVAFFSYLLGVVIAFFYVYILNAPFLRNIFLDSNDYAQQFELPFIVDLQTLFLVFFLSVPLYLASVIIPAWRVATLDADEVMR